MRGPLARKHGEEHYGRLDSRSERGHSSRTSGDAVPHLPNRCDRRTWKRRRVENRVRRGDSKRRVDEG